MKTIKQTLEAAILEAKINCIRPGHHAGAF